MGAAGGRGSSSPSGGSSGGSSGRAVTAPAVRPQQLLMFRAVRQLPPLLSDPLYHFPAIPRQFCSLQVTSHVRVLSGPCPYLSVERSQWPLCSGPLVAMVLTCRLGSSCAGQYIPLHHAAHFLASDFADTPAAGHACLVHSSQACWLTACRSPLLWSAGRGPPTPSCRLREQISSTVAADQWQIRNTSLACRRGWVGGRRRCQ